jgi:hypothetical protein
MRDLDNYSRSEWLRLLPLVHRLKHVRNRAVSDAYRRWRSDELRRFLAASADLAGRNLAIAIAFNTPWVIELLVRSAAANLQGTTLLVADNSSHRAARAEIAAICRSRAVPYVRLPANPEWAPNRSHGIAMNWIYDNIVCHFRPRAFAFLDHDLFPIRPVDLSLNLRDQPVYGMLRVSPRQDAWSLWAGFCVFDFPSVVSRCLDFNYESPLSLDTGGANWDRLYRFMDRRTMRFARVRRTQLDDPLTRSRRSVACIDEFVHVGGASYKEIADPAERQTFFRAVVDRIERGEAVLPV